MGSNVGLLQAKTLTLFEGNICKTWSKKDLKERLAHYSIDNYEDLTLVEDAKTEGMNRGFAFLEFSSRADALEVCKWLQTNHVVFGTDRTTRGSFADTFIEPDDEIMSQVQTVFLDGLPDTWVEDRLKEHLQKFGKIEKVELARNMPATKRKDFGFITFDNHGTVVACVDDINNAGLGDGDDRGCEREVAEAANGGSEELKGESLMRLSWALVHSRQLEDVQRGMAILEGLRSLWHAGKVKRYWVEEMRLHMGHGWVVIEMEG